MNFQDFIETTLVPIASKIGSNRYLIALRDGFTFSMPFLIVGSFILLLVNLPFTDSQTLLYQQWYVDLMAKYKGNLVQPFYVSMGIMSIFVVFGIGYNLSNHYKLSGITGGFLSLYTFLILAGQSDWIPYGGDAAKWGIQPNSWFPVIDARYFSAQGVFTAIIAAIFSVEVYKFLVQKNMAIKLPESVPPAVLKSFEALIPVVALSIVAQSVNIAIQSSLGSLFPEIIMSMFRPVLQISDTLVGTLTISFIVHILWFCGLHGTNVIIALLNPIILSNLDSNIRALSDNLPLPHILAGGFLDSFVYIGGAGATLGLAIAMMLSKSQHLKAIGRLSFAPGLFNINEPIMFGAPIVLNPILGIPFLLIPIFNIIVAYTLTNFGIIERVRTLVPWTTPAPIAAFFSTGLDIKSFVLVLLLLIISVFMYLPFIKAYDKALLLQEKE